MARRSKLGQWTSSASAKSEVLSPAVSLSVQRVTVPLVRSSEFASAAVRDQAGREPGNASLGAGRGVEHVQRADAVLVRDACNPPVVRRQIELVDIPRDRRRQKA